ncbi:MAG: hypothetical protein KAQ99_10225 [Candidatus Aureabacteria bacterium]|nr:hypothetical protein [Candidatus Auribacterota bacterium]
MPEYILTVKRSAVIKFRGSYNSLEKITAKEFMDALIPQLPEPPRDTRLTFHIQYKIPLDYKYKTTDPEAELKPEDADE